MNAFKLQLQMDTLTLGTEVDQSRHNLIWLLCSVIIWIISGIEQPKDTKILQTVNCINIVQYTKH